MKEQLTHCMPLEDAIRLIHLKVPPLKAIPSEFQHQCLKNLQNPKAKALVNYLTPIWQTPAERRCCEFVRAVMKSAANDGIPLIGGYRYGLSDNVHFHFLHYDRPHQLNLVETLFLEQIVQTVAKRERALIHQHGSLSYEYFVRPELDLESPDKPAIECADCWPDLQTQRETCEAIFALQRA